MANKSDLPNNIIRGKVIKGRNAGKGLGFPTANIRLHRKIPHGIYVSETKIKGKKFPSVTFVGNAATFDTEKVYVETYILNFNQNIYNKWISISLIKKLRDNKKFNDIPSLIVQIEKDVQEAKEYFKHV